MLNLFQDDTKTKINMNSLNDILSDKKEADIAELKKTVYQLKDQLETVIRALNQHYPSQEKIQNPDIEILDSGEQVIEGVFNGQDMVGSDGKEYPVPANYASKSKLVEGDMMKLTITKNGSFIYKQIGPIEKKRLIGELVSDGAQFSALADGKTYKLLTASVTFFKGKPGDEAVILVPQDSKSDWAAVENIIHK